MYNCTTTHNLCYPSKNFKIKSSSVILNFSLRENNDENNFLFIHLCFKPISHTDRVIVLSSSGFEHVWDTNYQMLQFDILNMTIRVMSMKVSYDMTLSQHTSYATVPGYGEESAQANYFNPATFCICQHED